MNKKLKMTAGVLFAIVIALSGCGVNEGAAPTASIPVTKNEEKKTVTVTLWVPWTQPGPMEGFNKIVTEFNKKYEAEKITAKVEFTPDFQQKLTTSLAAKIGPDLFIHGVGALPGFAHAGQLENITSQVESLSAKEDYLPQYLKLASFDNKVYGLPVIADYNVLFYRKDFFNEAGVKVPTTWKEFDEAAEKLTKQESGKITRLAMDIPVGSGNKFILQQHYGFFLQNDGGNFLTDDNKKSALNTPQALETLKWFDSLYTRKFVTVEGVGTPQGAQPVAVGTAAMQVGSLFQLMEIKKNSPEILEKLGVALPPKGPNGQDKKALLFTGPQVVMMNKDSANKEAAWKLADFLASKESLAVMAEKVGSVPLRKSMKLDFLENTPIMKEYINLAEQGQLITNPLTPKWVAVRDLVVKYTEETIYKHNPADTIKKADEEMNKVLLSQ